MEIRKGWGSLRQEHWKRISRISRKMDQVAMFQQIMNEQNQRRWRNKGYRATKIAANMGRLRSNPATRRFFKSGNGLLGLGPGQPIYPSSGQNLGVIPSRGRYTLSDEEAIPAGLLDGGRTRKSRRKARKSRRRRSRK